MTPDVMIAVLFGALLHACWNALIRGSTDRTLDTVLVVAGAAVIAACALPFAPLPELMFNATRAQRDLRARMEAGRRCVIEARTQ